MTILHNFIARLVIGGVISWLSLMLHVALGTSNPIGIVAIYVIFIAYVWAGASFQVPLLGKATLFALPNVFIPPLVLLPLRNVLDSWQLSWIIGVLMTVYTAFAIGWIINSARLAEKSASAAPDLL